MQWNSVPMARGWIRLFLCLVTGAVALAFAQSEKSEPTAVAELRAELQRLSLELLKYRAELIQWKMDSISAELQHVQAERQRLTGERLVIEREIGELTQANGAAAEDETRREELKAIQLPAILEGERAAAMREATLAAAFGAENARMTQIQKQVQHLKAQVTVHQ